MPKIIKDSQVIDDNWVVISDKEITEASSLPEGDLILPLSVWEKLNSELTDRNIGVWLDSDEAPTPLKDSLDSVALIAINFPAFADGRGYSYANVLRMQYGFQGELRAIGDVLRDQLFYMKRVGFHSFAMREDQKLEEAVSNLQDFNLSYQAAVDKQTPLFQDRT
jgi:uncharacterized protein (DUF934 family)